MVTEKELTGVQLFTGNGWEADFVQNYKVNGIPRFILIDPNGNIVDSDADRPSNPRLKELFKELGNSGKILTPKVHKLDSNLCYLPARAIDVRR